MITELTSELDHGDIAKIAEELRGNVSKADVYNILRCKSLNDMGRLKKVLDTTREFIADKKSKLGIQ